MVAVGYGWTRSVGGAAATLAVVALFGALHPTGFSSDWMPYVFVPAYFAFPVAIASVAAGRTQDCWLAALAGWFLIHGYAPFLLFVPVLAAAAVAAVLWRRWRERAKAEPISNGPCFHPRAPRVWIPVAAISAVFALPIVIELALHWPGNFARYFSYSSSAKSSGHTTAPAGQYVLWFWWPHAHAWAVPSSWRPSPSCSAGGCPRPATALLRGPAGGRRPLDRAVHGLRDGRDRLVQQLLLRRLLLLGGAAAAVLAIALAAIELLPGRIVAVAALAAAVAAAAAFAVAPLTRFDLLHMTRCGAGTGAVTDPTLGPGTAFLAKQADGRPLVLRIEYSAWPA